MPFPSQEHASMRAPMRAPNPFLRRRPTEIRVPEEAGAQAALKPTQKFDPLDTVHPVAAPVAVQPAAPAVTQEARPAAPPAPALAQPPAGHSPVAPPAMPKAPEAAPPALSPAERFRQLNKTLPDGVQYEPLDKETLRALQQTAIPPAAPTPAPPPQTLPAAVNHSDHIGQFIQDERNARVFYTHLAYTASRPEIAANIKNIAESCEERTRTLNDIYKRLLKQDFLPKDAEINTSVSLIEGISLAMTEENKSILALANWLDQRPDEETARAVQNIINHKIVRYNQLSHALSMA